MPRGESSGDSEYCSASSSVNFPGDWQDGGAAGAGAGTSRISWVSVGDPERNHGTSVEPGSDSGAGGAAFRELKPGTEERSYYSLKLGASLQSSRRDRYITLCVETCSSGTGKFLGAIFWTLMICFILYGTAVIVLSATDVKDAGLNVTDSYYEANLIILSISLALLVFMMVFFMYRLHSASTRRNRVWRKRQRYLLWDARIVSLITLIDLSCVVASYALYVKAECYPNQTALAILGFVRSLTFTGVVTWMTVTAMLMQVIQVADDDVGKTNDKAVSSSQSDNRGAMATASGWPPPRAGDEARKGGLAKNPTVRLLVDQPMSVILRKRGFVLAMFIVYVVAAVAVVLLRTGSVGQTGVKNIPPKLSCPANLTEPYSCSNNYTGDIISYVVLSVMLFGLWLCYIFAVRKAWAGQKNLPNARFRLSKLFLRIQMRYGRLLFFAILFTGMVVQLATIGTCRGRVNAVLGSPAAHMSLTAYACTLLFLYAPGTGKSDSVTMFKSIAWGENDIDGLMAELRMIEQGSESDVFEYLSRQMGLGKLSKLANVQESIGTSVFCMEYCIKMFYFAWSAYKRSARVAFAAAGDTSYPFSVENGLRVFKGLVSFKEFFDEETDTYCIMLRSHETIVLSFRGTASRKNAMTDIKLMSVRYEPCTSLHGLPVLVHKGFWKAWSTVREQIVEEVLALAVGGGVERLFVTGHSLGGALACLCSVELQARFNTHGNHGKKHEKKFGKKKPPRPPDPLDQATNLDTGVGTRRISDITDIEAQGRSMQPDLGKIEVHTYTFGAPRVGNLAFGAYANSLLSNYWHVVNTEDPVARIPKGLNYRRSGHRVLLGKNGNMEVYPSHFESSLFTNVGGKFADHMMREYGVRLGQFLKAQFIPDLTACESGAEVNAVRRMAMKLGADSLGLDGLLCCFLGNLEDGNFALLLHPNAAASAPGQKNARKERKRAESKAERTTVKCGRWPRLPRLPWLSRQMRPTDPSQIMEVSYPGGPLNEDRELGVGGRGERCTAQGVNGVDSVMDRADEADEADEADIEFQQGLDDKVLRILKDFWGE